MTTTTPRKPHETAYSYVIRYRVENQHRNPSVSEYGLAEWADDSGTDFDQTLLTSKIVPEHSCEQQVCFVHWDESITIINSNGYFAYMDIAAMEADVHRVSYLNVNPEGQPIPAFQVC